MEIGELIAVILDAVVGAPAAAPGSTVVQITAKVKGTRGVRKASDTRPDDVLTASSSTSKSLSGNAPVIVVRGCNDIELEAVTSPANQPVTWKIEKNENTDSPPLLIPISGHTKATLKTNKHGSYSVTAQIGTSKVVWNVVFVWVKVLTDTSVVKTQNTKYADNGSSAAATRFKSGGFVTGEYAWRARVTVRVVGGGNSKRLGTDKVKVQILQNGVRDTLTAHYTPAGTALEVPKGGVPVVDATGAGSPFITHPAAAKITPNQTDFERSAWTGDSPAGGFPGTHKNNGARISSISGVNGFVATIASVSDQAPNSIVVHAKIAWEADFSGTVDAAGVYTRSGAKTKSDKKYKRIADSRGGRDAFEAGIETFEPRFNGGVDTTWTP